MAPRFSWFLCPLLALLFCHDAAFSSESLQQIDIKTLNDMKGVVKGGGQFGVMHLSGRSLKNCHEIQFNDPTGVNADCNFAKVFKRQLKGNDETLQHSEWQLINTALEPMLKKWKESQAATECPKTLYLYTLLAPDYATTRRREKRTCTQAIVETIPKILSNFKCELTRIVVGFTTIYDQYKTEACEGYELMKTNNITAYHLDGKSPDFQPDCAVKAGGKRPRQPSPSKPEQGNTNPAKRPRTNG
ncbi:uncharacterized protein LOC125046746 [Penaeus chinensis]|uniref:uncharacterized protein LOC125046746 n=1 Tax=Penaeus chinensis TaxID=139456 RepID=UPI001FB82842|nr:uncharacterized protein LOC125046746 [Penaeus chinensis]XP_047500627.1 uncharacterized protein LOC125046746 [Penaeus chinensis]XP_047500628.1 uncharacterized protein LOC125046746 [Penaeus chinensis]